MLLHYAPLLDVIPFIILLHTRKLFILNLFPVELMCRLIDAVKDRFMPRYILQREQGAVVGLTGIMRFIMVMKIYRMWGIGACMMPIKYIKG